MNNKGFLGDFVFYFIFIFAIAIVIITIYMAYSQINDGLQSSDQVPTDAKSILSNSKTRFLNTWNWLLVLLLIGLFIGIVVLAFTIQSHPVFATLAILVLIVVGGISVFLANAFNGFASSSGISAYATEFSLIPFIMQRLPYFVVALGFVFIIVLYAKSRSNAIL